MRDCEERAKARWIQVDRAARLVKKAVDTTIPYYDEKRNIWCLRRGGQAGGCLSGQVDTGVRRIRDEVPLYLEWGDSDPAGVCRSA